MKIKKIEIDEKLSNYIECLDFDLKSRRHIIALMISQNYDIDTDAFKAYQKEATDTEVMFETAKRELGEMLEKKLGKLKNWRLDYATRTVYYETL